MVSVLFFLTVIAASFLPVDSASALIDPKRNLQKSLLSNLRNHYAGVGIANIPNTYEFINKPQEETKDNSSRKVNDTEFILIKLPNELQHSVLTFLSPQDLLKTRLVSHHFCNISNHASFLTLRDKNPDFVLEENWMNLALNNFLFKHFENGRLNEDDLLNTVESLLFKVKSRKELERGENIDTMNLLSFLYEYQNGPYSYIPLSGSALCLELVHKLIREDHLPKTKKIMDDFFVSFLRIKNFYGENTTLTMNIYNETIYFLKTNPDSEQVRLYFNFDPDLPLSSSKLNIFPLFFQVALFDWILPICTRHEHFVEAIEMASRLCILPPVLYDQMRLKFPMFVDSIFRDEAALDPAIWKAFYERGTIETIGLEYLLSKNLANPFNLQELLEMNPDIPQLMKAFVNAANYSLTCIDIITQIKEAGLFSEIRDVSLLRKLNSIIDGSARFSLVLRFALNTSMFR